MRLVSVLYALLACRLVLSGNGDNEGGLRGSAGNFAESNFERPNVPPKYFAIDHDETFHTCNGEAWARNINAFTKARKMGYTLFFCTGRSIDSTFRIAGDEFKAKTGYNGYPGIYNNGAMVYNEHGDVIYSKSFSRDLIKNACESVLNGSTDRFIFYTHDGYYSPSEMDTHDLKDFVEKRGLPTPQVKTPEEISSLQILKITQISKEANFPGFEQGKDYIAKIDLPGSWDIIPPGISKATGIKELMKHYDISPEECAFIGNGDNDVEAMKLSNLSFAVGNAYNHVKKAAKWVMEKTCDEGAVSKALELTYGFTVE
ncbi:haloacid dehalogenase-like hydrolase family member protein [Theileria equi strain WA]|uniref:Haloacid dehalogenase-like hydrolase family member protein n=1 Tax=Theileria equi strain WA TaxID=1537102 RepID=L1LDG9_THEEQ|nr:haloacid dehalogenase-like hydrolase family member protein [Theileria equi strain WA]EKX73497.1 haloacid dehalogenase-like hydrolase family member protein [Theileria equi strain WA]|eukprot:XP_004832949.1 haloacid dehalogenase-like hydrolase family member protein [Theileria equi strain WA]